MARMSEAQSETEIPQWDVADRMAKALRVSGVTPARMALFLGVHRNTIGNYVHGKSRPSRATLIAWADFTQFPLEWIETGQVSSVSHPGDNDRYRVAA